MNDGRFIDTTIATLEGEASHQTPEAMDAALPPPAPIATRDTYYERPMLKEPVWIWSIPAYFFVGGVAGAAMTLGLAVQLFGGRRLRGFDERCRWVGAVLGGVGSALLIWDLGRKGRFLLMLRVFRPTSPMSVGSWVLALATPLSAGSALLTMSDGWMYRLGYLAGMGAGALGMPLATYTAVLIGNSAVPVWSESRRTLPVLFGASSVASMASFFDLMALNRRERAIVRRFGLAGRVAELAAAEVVKRDAGRVERVGRPLREGATGALWKAAGVLTAASVVVSLLPGESRAKRRLSGILGMAGGAAIRFAIFYAGKISARDPRAAIQQQRTGHEDGITATAGN